MHVTLPVQELLQKRVSPTLVESALASFFGLNSRIDPRDLAHVHKLLTAGDASLVAKGSDRWAADEEQRELRECLCTLYQLFPLDAKNTAIGWSRRALMSLAHTGLFGLNCWGAL